MNAPHLQPWLADSLLHGTLLLGFALIAERILHRHSAARRHALLLGAALGLPLLLTTSFLLPSWSLSTQTTSPASVVEVTASREIVLGAPTAPAASANPASAPVAMAKPAPVSLASTLIIVWLSGVAFLWLRWGLGCLALRRLARQLPPSTAFDTLLREECRALGIPALPRVLFGDKNAMPMTWGLRRHRIVLPSEATTWTESKLRGVLRHELAHIARRDCATSSLGSLGLALTWFHPFTWLLQRALRRTREAACDDRVVSRPPPPSATPTPATSSRSSPPIPRTRFPASLSPWEPRAPAL